MRVVVHAQKQDTDFSFIYQLRQINIAVALAPNAVFSRFKDNIPLSGAPSLVVKSVVCRSSNYVVAKRHGIVVPQQHSGSAGCFFGGAAILVGKAQKVAQLPESVFGKFRGTQRIGEDHDYAVTAGYDAVVCKKLHKTSVGLPANFKPALVALGQVVYFCNN